MFWVGGVRAFSESRCLEVFGASDGVLYACLLDVAHPYCVDLCASVPSAGICFVVYVPVIVFAGTVVAGPSSWIATAAFRGTFSSFRRFPFLAPVCWFRFPAFVVISFSARAGEFLFVGVTSAGDACCIRAVSVEHRRKGGILLNRRAAYSSGEKVQFLFVSEPVT